MIGSPCTPGKSRADHWYWCGRVRTAATAAVVGQESLNSHPAGNTRLILASRTGLGSWKTWLIWFTKECRRASNSKPMTDPGCEDRAVAVREGTPRHKSSEKKLFFLDTF